MKFIGGILLLVPGLLAAQNWSSCPSPCVISAQISAGKLTLVHPEQAYIEVKAGTRIQWTVSGASYFLIAMDFNTVMFGPDATPFFFSASSSATGGTVTGATSSSGDHYFIYASDSSGKKYALDPKVRTTTGLNAPGAPGGK